MSTDPRAETIRLLSSIDAKLGALLELAQRKQPVSDAVITGPHGDPVIKAKDPRDWSGPSMRGKHFSECPPEYLDQLAERYDYFATKETEDKKRRYAELDAQRARKWAERLRSGYQPAPARVDETLTEPTW